MGAPAGAINLQFGKSGFSYQDVIRSHEPSWESQSMPSARGSHSEISGT
jgi:hypothetical protein